MFTGKRPDITPAQLLAALTWVLSQAVAFGWLDSQHSQTYLSIGASIISAGWMVGDAVLRGLRNVGGAAPTPSPGP